MVTGDGASQSVKTYIDTEEPGEFRWIVLSDGSIKGARKGIPTGASKGAGFSWPCID